MTSPDLTPATDPAPSSSSYRFAGFWVRVLATLIDGLIIAVLAVLLRTVLPGNGGDWGYALLTPSISASLAEIILIWLYAALMESSAWRATVGKRAMGLVVVDMQGRRISFARATGRHAAKWLSSLLLCIGYLMVAFTQRKQGLHDMLANTLVLSGPRTNDPVTPPQVV